MPSFLVVSYPKKRKFIKKSKKLSRKSLHNLTDSDNSSNPRRRMSKESSNMTIIRRFLESIRFYAQRKMEQILLAYCHPKETITATMKLTKTQKQWFAFLLRYCHWSLGRDTLSPYLFILCLDYVLQKFVNLIKENGFTLKMHEADDILQTLTDADYIRRRTSRKFTSLSRIPSTKLRADNGSIGIFVNANEIEYICFKK